MSIGIIILNYNTVEDTVCCVKSIRNVIGEMVSTIYIVDNCSTDSSQMKLNAFFEKEKDIVLIHLKQNRGYAYGNNMGIKRAIADGHDAILISNPDVEYKPDSIKYLYEYLMSHHVGVVGPLIYNAQGKLDLNAQRTLEYKGSLLLKKPFVYLKCRYGKYYSLRNYNCLEPIIFDGMVMGCCFMIKAKVAEKVGYFDEGTFLYFEENILGKKLSNEKIPVAIVPYAKIIHKGGGTTSKIGIKSVYYHYCSQLYGLLNYCHIKRYQIITLFIINSVGLFYRIICNNYKELWIFKRFLVYYFEAIRTMKASKIKGI